MSKFLSALVAAGLAVGAVAPASAASLFTLTVADGTMNHTPALTGGQALNYKKDAPLWTISNTAGSLGSSTIITQIVLNIVHDAGETYVFDYGYNFTSATSITRVTTSDITNNNCAGGVGCSTTFTLTFPTLNTATTSATSFSVGEAISFQTDIDKNNGSENSSISYIDALNNATVAVTYKLANGTTQTAYSTINFANSSNTSFSFNGALAAVPEPSSWMMMIGGFGLVGAAMRRRRSPTVTFA